jgi:hypothetical protein
MAGNPDGADTSPAELDDVFDALWSPWRRYALPDRRPGSD